MLSAQYVFTNVISSVLQVYIDKAVYGNDLTGNGQRQMAGAECKSVALMEDFVLKFSKPVYLTLYTFATKFSTTKA